MKLECLHNYTLLTKFNKDLFLIKNCFQTMHLQFCHIKLCSTMANALFKYIGNY